MSSFEGKKVIHVTTHGPLFVPGIGQFGPNLSSGETATTKGCEMVIDGDSVIVKVKGQQANQSATLVIHRSGFTHIVLAK
jgi:hypothetical protein